MNKKKLAEMRKKRAGLVAEMRKLSDTAETEKRGMTEEEAKAFDDLEAQVNDLAAKIDRVEKLLDAEESITEEGEETEGEEEDERSATRPARRPAIADVRNAPRGPEARKSFENLGEFLDTIRSNPNDQRLEYRDMSMSQGASGGFMVPKQFLGELLKVEPDDALVRPRARVLPAGTPPDAGVDIPALNQGVSSNVYGGVEVQWIGEGETKPQTDAKLRQVSLVPQEVAAHIVVTDKLLRNWSASSAFIEGLLRGAILGAEDYAFLFGDGKGKPLGVLNAGNRGAIKVSRKVQNQIAWEDILALEESFKGTSGIYVASRKAHTAISQIKDASGRYIWQESAAPGAPATLNGRPYFRRDELPGLGTTGDLALLDLSHYLVKDGSGIFVDISQHVHFTSNRTVIKAYWNVDGQPWVDGPFKTVAGDTVSPFSILKKETT